MFDKTKDATNAVVSVIAYRNILAMVDWLCDAFGFERQLIVKGDTGEVRHAQLTFGESIIMVVPVEGSAFEKLVVHPEQTGGAETQTCYLVVADLEAHHARAKAKGAEIIFGIRVENNSARGYASRDPEGHVWVFGTYDPRNHGAITASGHQVQRAQIQNARGRQAWMLTTAALLSAVVVSATWAAVWTYYNDTGRPLRELDRTGQSAGALQPAHEAELTPERNARDAAERDAKRLAAKLAETSTAKERAERSAASLLEQLATERATHDGALRSAKTQDLLAQKISMRDREAAKQAADQLGRERMAREAAEKLARDATEELDRMRFAKVAAEQLAKEAADSSKRERVTCSNSERATQDAVARLVRERNARAAAELATGELRAQLFVSNAEPQQQIAALRDQIDAERHTRQAVEGAVRNAQQLLAQEKHSRDATERALKQAHQQPPASCWSCPSAFPCGPK